MTKVSLNNGNQTKLDNSPCDVFKSGMIFFIGHKTIKHFNDFYN